MSDLEIKETDKMETIRNDNGDLKTSATEDVKISVIVDEDSKSKAKTEEIITEDDKHIKNDVDDMVVAVEQAKNGKINDNGDDTVAVKIVDDNSSKTETEEIFTADDKHIQNDIQQFLVAAHDVGVIVEQVKNGKINNIDGGMVSIKNEDGSSKTKTEEIFTADDKHIQNDIEQFLVATHDVGVTVEQVKNGKINDIDGGMVSIKNENGSSRASTEEVITEDDKHVKNYVDELIGAEHGMRVAIGETKNEKINDIGGNIVAVKNDDKDSDTGEMIDDEHIKNDVDRLCDIGVVKESRNGNDQHTANDIESDIVAVKNLDESVEDILKQSVLDEEPVTDSDDYQDVASESFSQTIEVNPEDLPFFGRSDDLTDLNDEQNLDVTIEIQNENAHKNMTAAGGSAGTTDQLTSINFAETTKPAVTTDNLTETTASTNISATPKVKKGVGVKKVKMKKHDDTTDETCDKVRLKKVKSRAVNDKRVVTTSAVVAADDNEENEDDDDMWTDNDESSLPWHLDVEESDSGGLITKKKVKAKPKANKKVTIGPNDEIIDLGSWKGADRMTAAALLAAATSTKKKPKSAKAESSTTKTATKKKPTTATTKKPKPETETGGVEVKKKVKPDDDAKIVNKIKADDGKSAEKPEGISYKKRAIDRDNRESADESTDNTTDDDDDDDEEEEDQVSFANFNIRTSTLRGGDSGRLVTPATDLLKTKLSIMNNASAVVPLREPKPRDRLQTAEIYMTRTSSSFVDDMNKRTVDSAVNRKSTGKLDDKVPMMFDKDGKPIIEIPLPVDEDRKNPQFIPKRGGFYEHDLRNEEEDEDQSTAAAAIPEEEEEEEEEELKTDKQLKSSKSLAKPRTADRWTHDLYDENDQAPKTSEDIITEYGYDIRKEDSAPKTRRRKKYSGNVTKYNRKSDDADAYIKKPTKKRETQGFYVRGQGLGDRKRQPTIEEPSSSIGVTAESALSSQPSSSSPPSSATVEKSSHPIGASRPVYDTGGSSSSRRFSDPKESYHRRNMRYDDGPPHNTTTSERPVYNTNRTMHDRRSQQMPVGGPPPPPTSYANWKQPQDTDYARKRFSDGDRQQQQQHQFAPWRDKGGYNRNNDNNRHDDKQRAPMYHRGSGVDERGGGGGNNLLQQRMDKFRGRGEMPYGRRGKPDDTGTTATSAVAEKNSSSAVVDSTPVSPYASTTAYASASSSASAYPSASSFQRQLSMIKQQSTTNNTAAAEKVTQRIAHDVTFNISFTGLPNTDIDTPIIRRREPADEQQSSAVKTTATATDYKQTIQQLENSFQHTRFDGGGDSELLPELPLPQQTDDAKSIVVGVAAAVVVDKEDEEVAQLTAAQQYQSSSNNNNNAELSSSMTLPIFQQSVATSSNIVRFTKPPFKTSATATASSSSSSLAAAASSDRKLTYNRYEKQSKPYHHPIGGTANNNTTYSVIQPSEYRTPIFQRDNDDSRSTTVQTSEPSKSAEFKSRSYKYEPRKSENPAEEKRTTADNAEQAKTEEKTVVPQPPRKLHIRFSARRGRRDTKTSETAETVSKMQQSLETKEIENTFENPTVVHATPIETPPVVHPPPLAEPIQHVPYYHHQGYPDETSAAASGMYMPDPNIAPYVTYLPPGPPLIPPTANQTPAISYHHPGILNYPPSPGTYNPDQFMPPVTFVDTTHGPEPQVVADMYQSHDGVTYYNVHHSPQNSHGQNAAGATRRMNAIPIIPPSVSSPLPPRPSAPEPK